MTIPEVISEFKSKNRRMGCVQAAHFVIRRLKNFKPIRYERVDSYGYSYGHVVATDGNINIDLVPHLFAPDTIGPIENWNQRNISKPIKNIVKTKDPIIYNQADWMSMYEKY
jgi:hypothetical protein